MVKMVKKMVKKKPARLGWFVKEKFSVQAKLGSQAGKNIKFENVLRFL